MKKIYCFLGKKDTLFGIADLSNVFINTSVPSISEEYRFDWEYPFDKELEVGQLFSMHEEVSPGKIIIKVDPIDFDKYKSFLTCYRLFVNSGNSSIHSNSLKNKVLNLLDRYYDKVVVSEMRHKKINVVLNGKN